MTKQLENILKGAGSVFLDLSGSRRYPRASRRGFRADARSLSRDTSKVAQDFNKSVEKYNGQEITGCPQSK